MTGESARREVDRQERGLPANEQTTIARILLACAAIELLLLFWLLAIGRDAFNALIWTPDTPSYAGVAQRFAETFTLPAGPRTLGYPLFLAAGYVIGGPRNGSYVVIVVQLILNLGLAWGCWRLLQRLAPAAGVRLRGAATLFLFWAGLGMAVFLMSDFLAAASFAVFLYGMLFWRSRSGVVLAGLALALATLTRPTFTALPVLLPAAAYLVGHITSKVPVRHLIAFAICSLSATTVSVTYQYTLNGYLGPSPFLTIPIQEMLYHGTVKGQAPPIDYASFQKQFAANVEQRAGQPFATLPPAEQEMYAKQIFREGLMTHPGGIVSNIVKNGIKYVFVPVESTLQRLWGFYASDQAYMTHARPIVGLICLPIWLLSLIPPVRSPHRHKMYYALMMGCLLYIVGLSAMGTASGERIRFPVLAFMLPVAVWNIQAVHLYLLAWIERRGRTRTACAAVADQ